MLRLLVSVLRLFIKLKIEEGQWPGWTNYSQRLLFTARNVCNCVERPEVTKERKTRILLPRLGLDGQDRGVQVPATLLMKEGL